MKYIIYCRKSTDTEDKQVQSLDSQESELRALAERHSLNVVEVLKESQSAKMPGRPIFALMMQKIITGEADAILCWKVDRLARNFFDGGPIIHSLQSNIIKEIRTPSERHLPTDNVLMLSVQMGMANQYSRDLSENVKRGNRSKLERGEWPNRAPFGYLNDTATKTLIHDPDRSRYVRRTFELYATGNYSLSDIAAQLYKDGLRSSTGNRVYISAIKCILDKSFYYGVMERGGKSYLGKHEPLISKETYDTCRAIAAGVSRPREKTLFFPLRGLMQCEVCGCAITASLQKGHQYYYCTNGKGNCEQHRTYLREIDLHKQVAEKLDLIRFDEELIEISYLAAKELYAKDTSYAEQAIELVRKRLYNLDEREKRAGDAFTDGHMRKDHYEAKMAELARERITTTQELERARHTNPFATLEPTHEMFLQANKATFEYVHGNDHKKHEIASKVLWNLSMKDKNIAQYKFRSPYSHMAKVPKNADSYTMLPNLDSNQDTLLQRE